MAADYIKLAEITIEISIGDIDVNYYNYCYTTANDITCGNVITYDSVSKKNRCIDHPTVNPKIHHFCSRFKTTQVNKPSTKTQKTNSLFIFYLWQKLLFSYSIISRWRNYHCNRQWTAQQHPPRWVWRQSICVRRLWRAIIIHWWTKFQSTINPTQQTKCCGKIFSLISCSTLDLVRLHLR